MSRTVLLISYEFPPSAGAGVQRLAKFARYLPQSGWRPIVVCADPIPGRPHDDTLLDQVAEIEVHRIPGRHVGDAIARLLSPLKRTRASRTDSAPAHAHAPTAAPSPVEASASSPQRRVPLSSRLSRIVAVPDDAAYWIAGAADLGVRIGREARVDAVVASGPPHSALVAGARVARILGVPLVLDVRDAWVNNPAAAWATGYHRARSVALEREVMGAAAAVVAVSDPIAQEAEEFGARRTLVLPNGYDPSEMPRHVPGASGAALRLAFMGRVYGPTDISPLIEAIAKLGGQVTLDIAGPPSPLLDAAITRFAAGAYVTQHGYLSHAQALQLAASADAGAVTLVDGPGSRSVYTGKLFEYLGMRLPVLLVGPADGVAADLIAHARAGWTVPYSDVPALVELLKSLAAEKAAGGIVCDFAEDVLSAYERPQQAAALAALLDEVTP